MGWIAEAPLTGADGSPLICPCCNRSVVALHIYKEDGAGIKIPAVHFGDGVTDQDIDEQLDGLSEEVLPHVLACLGEIPPGVLLDIFEDARDVKRIVIVVTRIKVGDLPDGLDLSGVEDGEAFVEFLRNQGLI